MALSGDEVTGPRGGARRWRRRRRHVAYDRRSLDRLFLAVKNRAGVTAASGLQESAALKMHCKISHLTQVNLS